MERVDAVSTPRRSIHDDSNRRVIVRVTRHVDFLRGRQCLVVLVLPVVIAEDPKVMPTRVMGVTGELPAPSAGDLEARWTERVRFMSTLLKQCVDGSPCPLATPRPNCKRGRKMSLDVNRRE